MTDICRDLINRCTQMQSERSWYEDDWKSIADFFLPSSSRSFTIGQASGYGTMDQLTSGASTQLASRRRFDSTPISALDRLSAGMESLVCDPTTKWQENAPTDPLAPEPSDEERKWYERLRDYQFAIRYSSLSGFGNANQKYIRSICAFGTGIIYIEEAFGSHDATAKQLPVIYQHIPLSQAFLSCNAQGNHDTLFRRFSRSARQIVQKFGNKCSDKVKEMADDIKRQDQQIDLIHAVQPRMEAGSRAMGHVRNAPWASFYVEVEGANLIGESGFYEFPFAIGTWIQTDESPYGESPALAALDDVRGLNATRKSVLTMMQTAARPPLAVAHDGVMNRPNMNPGAINMGAIDANGRQKIQPITGSANPAIGKELIEDLRMQVKDLMYNNLFQILVQNPQMTAHEAMLRAAEKGDLLGPNGVKIQQGFSALSDREIGILERKGAFRQGASLEPPKTMRGKSYGARFVSQLDLMRQSKDAAGIMQTYQAAGQIASLRQSPAILDLLDDDVNLKTLARINGMPESGLVNAEIVAAVRDARTKAMQAQQSLMAANSAADTAQKAAQGESAASDAQATQKQAGTGGGASSIATLLGAAKRAGLSMPGQGGGPSGGPSIAPGLTTAPLPLPQLAPAGPPTAGPPR